MRSHLKIVLAIGALALGVSPAMTLAGPSSQGAAHGHKGTEYSPAPETPGPGASLPEKAKAYGHFCQGESKRHVAGQRGTPFSQCVTAMAKAARNEKLTARQACKGLSKNHVKGEKGTPFSRCVVAAAKLRRAKENSSG